MATDTRVPPLMGREAHPITPFELALLTGSATAVHNVCYGRYCSVQRETACHLAAKQSQHDRSGNSTAAAAASQPRDHQAGQAWQARCILEAC